MMKKQFLLLPLLAMSLIGCKSGGGSSTVTLSIWEDESNKEMVETLTKEFLADYRKNYPNAPKIEIEITTQAEKSAIEEMTRGISESGNGPDIAAVTHDTIASGVYSKVLAPASHADGIKYRMTEEAVNSVTVDGTVYGYPITAESTTVMYNSDLMSEADFASFEAMKTKLSSLNKTISWNVTGDNGGYYSWGLCVDSVLFGEDGKTASEVNIATTKSCNNVLSFFKDYSDIILDETPEDAVSSIENGRSAALVSSPFILASMKQTLGNKLKLAKLPKMNDEDLRPFSGYKAYVVSKYSKNGALAQELCDYLTSYDSNLYRLEQKGYLPACPLDATDDIKNAIANSAEATVFADSLEHSIPMPNITEMKEFWKPMNNACTYFKQNSATLTLEVVQSKLGEVTTAIRGN